MTAVIPKLLLGVFIYRKDHAHSVSVSATLPASYLRTHCGINVVRERYYRIRRNIGSALIWWIAESSHLADFNIGGRARGNVSNTLDKIISIGGSYRNCQSAK